MRKLEELKELAESINDVLRFYRSALDDTKRTIDEKNETINSTILYVLHTLDRNGDEIDNGFSVSLNADGTYSFNATGSKLQRFLADTER